MSLIKFEFATEIMQVAVTADRHSVVVEMGMGPSYPLADSAMAAALTLPLQEVLEPALKEAFGEPQRWIPHIRTTERGLRFKTERYLSPPSTQRLFSRLVSALMGAPQESGDDFWLNEALLNVTNQAAAVRPSEHDRAAGLYEAVEMINAARADRLTGG